ncbi:hypothetical protein SteCoe_23392 [Stentor coeruleus]|uniref:C2 domain-containing protein n=1 Tax=Stentor coeruleus TaxID=5963 RepID=A0A1R2BJZ1_9CILI|nr:hypothetical protein SteCoe_23392 [Stentor coeruleus]
MVESAFQIHHELLISAENLIHDPNEHLTSYCIVYIYDQNKEIGRTEVIENEPSPNWENTIRIPTNTFPSTRLKFSIIGIKTINDTLEESLNAEEEIAIVNITISEIMNEGCKISKGFKRGDGKIKVKLQVINQDVQKLHFQFSANRLAAMDNNGKSDPYLIIKSKGKKSSEIHRTEVVKKSLDPVWGRFILSSSRLFKDNPERRLIIECWDWDALRRDDLIGTAEVGIDELLLPIFEFSLYTKGVFSGVIKSQCTTIPSFAEYCHSGLELNFNYAIDFSKTKSDIHNFNGKPGTYIHALSTLAPKIEEYDHDKIFFGYGFGGFRPNQTNEWFYLTEDLKTIEIDGYQNIIVNYTETIKIITPCNDIILSPLIERIREVSISKPGDNEYNVLMIFTHGKILDIDNIKTVVVRTSMTPMSIVVIEVGNAKNSNLKKLIGKKEIVAREEGVEVKAVRNNVQFYRLRDFIKNPDGLITTVMNRICEEVSEYFAYLKNIRI